MNDIRRSCVTLALLLSGLLTACRTIDSTRPPRRTISGRVVDSSNKPIAGVQVRAQGRTAALTGAGGEFTIANSSPSERFAVSFSASRFIETTRVYDTRRNPSIRDVVMIWPRSAPQPLNATRGGTLTFAAGTVTIPPRALVDDRARPMEGDVRVSFSAFDVTDPRQYRGAPGDFTARMRDGSIRRLDTFGVFEIHVEDERGNRADLARGQVAGVELIVPETLRPAETVGSYKFEERSGRWIETGTFRRLRPLLLATEVASFTVLWNADDVMNTTCLEVTAECDCPTVSTASFSVQGEGVDYAHSFTANKGDCVDVKTNATLTLTPMHSNMNAVPVEITTSGTLANCSTPSGCRKVTFRCPSPLPIVATLGSCADTGWYCADGFSNGHPAFGVVWKDDQMTFASGAMTLGLQPCSSNCDGKAYEAAQFQSTCYYGYGKYEAKFQAAAGSGVVTSFFTYTGPEDGPRQDEIDIEIFGRPGTDKGCQAGESALQANYFANGIVAGSEKVVCLPFDATQQARRYGFDWQPGGITWYADKDGNDVLDATDVIHAVTSGPLPSQPGKIMVNMWAGSTDANTVTWLGPFVYDANNPNVAIYQDIRYTP
jgi:endo-1,3-1,4-beta-glycanase ExoK